MFNSTKALVMLSAVLIISCATGPSGKTFDSATGVWSDKYTTMGGKTRLRQPTRILMGESNSIR
jgi:hypothetical protein